MTLLLLKLRSTSRASIKRQGLFRLYASGVFFTPWKYRKTRSSLTFIGVVRRDQWHGLNKSQYFDNDIFFCSYRDNSAGWPQAVKALKAVKRVFFLKWDVKAIKVVCYLLFTSLVCKSCKKYIIPKELTLSEWISLWDFYVKK